MTDEMRKSAVTEIQSVLRAISLINTQYPKLVVDGIYGPETANAVRIFQRASGLPVTGELDRTTFDRIISVGRALAELYGKPEPITPFQRRLADGKVSLGDASDITLLIQLLLKAINIAFTLPSFEVSGKYDEDTAAAVRHFQKSVGLPQTGDVDKFTWNRLARAYNKYVDAE